MIIKNEHIIGKVYKGTTPVRKMYGGTSLAFNNGIESLGGGDEPAPTPAQVGDVLMWDVTNQKLVKTLGGNWDETTYPIASYEPIAICAIPSTDSSDGKSRWVSALEPTTAGTGVSNSHLRWENKISVMHNANSSDGRINTDIIVGQADFSATMYPAFYAVNAYHTNGTSAGDWYLPAINELSSAYNGLTAINGNLTAINVASSSMAEPIAATTYWSSSEYSAIFARTLNFSNGRVDIYNDKGNANRYRVRAFLAL